MVWILIAKVIPNDHNRKWSIRETAHSIIFNGCIWYYHYREEFTLSLLSKFKQKLSSVKEKHSEQPQSDDAKSNEEAAVNVEDDWYVIFRVIYHMYIKDNIL